MHITLRNIVGFRAPLIVAVGFILLLALACSGGGGSGGSSAPAITVKMSEFKFDPAQLTATAGQPLKLTLQNSGTVVHDFSAKDLPGGSSPKVSPGQSVTFEFTPAKAGTYEFICSVPGHEAAGMKGTLTVK